MWKTKINFIKRNNKTFPGNPKKKSKIKKCCYNLCSCRLNEFYKKIPQSDYWIIFHEDKIDFLSVYYYLMNLHPEPINTYAYIRLDTMTTKIDIEFLKINKSVDIGKTIIPDLHWLLPINEPDDSYPYGETALSKLIYTEWIGQNTSTYGSEFLNDEYQIEWIKKHLANTIPDDIILPQKVDNDDNDPINILADGFIHNLEYGNPEGLVHKNEHSQYKYWFPFIYDYDCPLKIYLINLHPEPKNIFGMYTKYRETDYSSGGEGKFRIIDSCKLNNQILPTIEKFWDIY